MSKYPTLSPEDEFVCLCAICQKGIMESQLGTGKIVDQKIYKCGELSYIELAHRECAPDWE